MESANLGHLHQLQEQVGGGSSPSLAVPSVNGVGGNHPWSQSLLLNGCNLNSNFDEVVTYTRDLRQNSNIQVHPSLNTLMLQDYLGFRWGTCAESDHSNLAKIEDLSDSVLSKVGHDPCSSTTLDDPHFPSTSYIKQEHNYLQDLNDKLFLRNLSSSGFHLSGGDHFHSNSTQISSTSFGAAGGRGNYCRILPSANVSSQNNLPSSFASSLGINLQALDLLASPKVGVDMNLGQPLLNNLASFRGVHLGLDHLHDSSQGLSTNSQKMPLLNVATETKRVFGISEPKPSQSLPKKPRLESRSLPPFKVRKEKLGDRIAALQQLVAPFGKTDTASVLLEAIAYIKLLQVQIETLSVPYMKNNARVAQGGLNEEGSNEQAKRDLRSRGLCLVPLSCTSYVTSDNGSVWTPPNYSGGT